jgi:AbrB family looped-hinge helix DNA binding protein
MALSKVTTKGQVTIPAEIRRHLELKPGDQVDFVIDNHGHVCMVPMNVDIKKLSGFLAPARRHLTVKQMNDAIEDAAVERYRRTATRR